MTNALPETKNGTVATVKPKEAAINLPQYTAEIGATEKTAGSKVCSYQVDDKKFNISASDEDFQVLLAPKDTLTFNLC